MADRDDGASTPRRIGVSPTRGSLDLELGYIVTPRFLVRGFASFHRTYEGEDWITITDGGDVGVHETGSTSFSAQASDADYSRLGVGTGLQLTDRISWFVVGMSTIDGKNVDDADILMSGFAWKFRTPWSYDW